MARERRRLLRCLSGNQNHRCAYCGVPMYVPGLRNGQTRTLIRAALGCGWKFAKAAERWRTATLDHIIPRCEPDGADGGHNLVAACKWCNQYRANQPAEVAFERIQRLVRSGQHPHFRAWHWRATRHKPPRVSGRASLPTVHRSAA